MSGPQLDPSLTDQRRQSGQMPPLPCPLDVWYRATRIFRIALDHRALRETAWCRMDPTRTQSRTIMDETNEHGPDALALLAAEFPRIFKGVGPYGSHLSSRWVALMREVLRDLDSMLPNAQAFEVS